MLITKRISIAFFVVILAATIPAFIVVNHNTKDSGEPNFISHTTISDNLGNTVISDYEAYDTIKDLSKESDCIVVGEVIKMSNNSRNLAKDPKNPKEDAKDWKCMSQEYDFQISQWLKGNGENNISIVYPGTTELSSEAKIESSNPLEPGQKYILFLKNGVEGTYYGTAEPWQFKIVSENIQVVSIEDVQIRDLKEMTEANLLNLLNKYLSK